MTWEHDKKSKLIKYVVCLVILIVSWVVAEFTPQEFFWWLMIGVAIGIGDAVVKPPLNEWIKSRLGCPRCRGDEYHPRIAWHCEGCGRLLEWASRRPGDGNL